MLGVLIDPEACCTASVGHIQNLGQNLEGAGATQWSSGVSIVLLSTINKFGKKQPLRPENYHPPPMSMLLRESTKIICNCHPGRPKCPSSHIFPARTGRALSARCAYVQSDNTYPVRTTRRSFEALTVNESRRAEAHFFGIIARS